MDELRAVLSSPYTWIGLGIAALAGVFWWALTPSMAGVTLAFGAVALIAGVLSHPWTAQQSFPAKFVIAVGLAVVIGAVSVGLAKLRQRSAEPTVTPESVATEVVKQLKIDGLLAEADSGVVASRTFALKREEGANFSIGPCPDCLRVTMGKRFTDQGDEMQAFVLEGGIFTFTREDRPDPKVAGQRTLTIKNTDEFSFHGGPGTIMISPQTLAITAGLAIRPNAAIHIHTKRYLIKLVTLANQTESVRFRVEVKGSST
jgi:hypothetical protein